jgi:anti-sigma28 factor (negative regulator of flagellin synthesis)
MRIDDNTATTVYGSSASSRTLGTDLQTRWEGAKETESSVMDQVNLSDASSLIALAKQNTLADRQARVSTIISQVRAGQYQADIGQVGRAIVQGHLTG